MLLKNFFPKKLALFQAFRGHKFFGVQKFFVRGEDYIQYPLQNKNPSDESKKVALGKA